MARLQLLSIRTHHGQGSVLLSYLAFDLALVLSFHT
jgi:hypothetical protein